jgi:PAS domain S-box-containing protein
MQDKNFLIVGDGEMAERTRDLDWARTPVGAVENWPDTLLITVNLLLASKHPMFLWWGADLIQFYNDGYRESLRADKHPAALGQRGEECWPEIWSIIGPQIAGVMERGESTWNRNQLIPIRRNEKLEEVFWTYSYSPVKDREGKVQGTLVVCSDTTEQVLAERRLRVLLAISEDSPGPAKSSDRVLNLARDTLGKLAGNGADIPFASLYLLTGGEALQSAATSPDKRLGDPESWPLAEWLESTNALLLEDLSSRFGDVTLPPWPEPLRQAFVQLLGARESQIRAVLVCGISPRLPFDEGYRTFLQLIGVRIGTLLNNEAHRLELAESARRFSRLAEANPFGMMIGDLRGGIEYMNPAFLETLGYTEEDVRSGAVRWDHLTPPEYREVDERAIQQLRTTGRCDVYEKTFLAKDGRRVAILIGAAAIDPVGGDPEIAAFVTDLTTLKMAQEALRKSNEELEKQVEVRTTALQNEIFDRERAERSLRELTGRLLQAQDEERRHMARELHDHAGQTLVALGFNLHALLEKLDGKGAAETVDLVKSSQQLSDGLSKEIRTLSYLLHPPLLDEAGLKSALRWYVEGFSKRSGIRVDLELPEDSSRLPREIEIVVFRIAQEGLTNVHRHSGSSWASIRLVRSKDHIQLDITDKGVGFSRGSSRDVREARVGVGVRGMEERVRQFGGLLRIDSGPTGTRVSAMIPLEWERAEPEG